MSATSENTARTESAVVSADGTTIAFQRSGSGPAVILVASALADRSDGAKLAGLLARHFTVINYDRRGRGASGDGARYAVEREIEDIAALLEHCGGSASVFGSSSGAVLALRAAAAGLDIPRLALYEPPFAVDGDAFGPPADFAGRIDALLAEDRRGDAVKLFMTKAQGMPGLLVASMRLMPGVWSGLKALAPTLPYDIAVMGDTQRGEPLKADEWSSVASRTLVLTGGKSPEGFHQAARALTEVLPHAEHRTLDGLHHGAVVMAPKKLAPSLVPFLAG
ncbi:MULTISPECIES: alpha/beta fold hydrolase [unclassified Streptomyces]|uniref:alpha/beta fold hydrolase n=1 Tax=unclassified Streptomyces TaxID=2593676 RepID=UPI0019047F13|nr:MULTISPECIES: alpha/beta hydrolase [unclassified Streptomyces]MCU4747372.1 alpha/beta hydrolase [Streptomyces sp. G-5]QQN77999.1 alpha/beta hydrolase [Streptomyces sp. XC 2026]